MSFEPRYNVRICEICNVFSTLVFPLFKRREIKNCQSSFANTIFSIQIMNTDVSLAFLYILLKNCQPKKKQQWFQQLVTCLYRISV